MADRGDAQDPKRAEAGPARAPLVAATPAEVAQLREDCAPAGLPLPASAA